MFFVVLILFLLNKIKNKKHTHTLKELLGKDKFTKPGKLKKIKSNHPPVASFSSSLTRTVPLPQVQAVSETRDASYKSLNTQPGVRSDSAHHKQVPVHPAGTGLTQSFSSPFLARLYQPF